MKVIIWLKWICFLTGIIITDRQAAAAKAIHYRLSLRNLPALYKNVYIIAEYKIPNPTKCKTNSVSGTQNIDFDEDELFKVNFENGDNTTKLEATAHRGTNIPIGSTTFHVKNMDISVGDSILGELWKENLHVGTVVLTITVNP